MNFAWRKGQLLGLAALGLLFLGFLVVLLNIVRFNREDYILLALLLPIFVLIGALVVSRSRFLRGVQSGLEHERRELEDQQWVDTTARSLGSQFKESIDPEKIAEILVDGLGRALAVDSVLFYAFAQAPMPKVWKQWHQNSRLEIEESLFADYESGLFDLVGNLWSRERVIVVNDSRSLDSSRDPIPGLATITQDRARSWMLVPLGAGTYVLGSVGVGMREDARVWSAAEIALVRKVVSDVANVFVHARLFTQERMIGENANEVGRLVELDKVKTDLIENMSHELRTPLTSIIGYMEVILEDVESDVDPELAELLSAVQRNAIRLQSLIENMMQLSKVDFEQMPMEIVRVDLGHLLGDVVKSMEFGADDSGVKMTLRLDSPAGDLLIDGDANRLERVFVNLASNALKFTPRKGTVSIRARRVHAAGDFVEVKVTDTGIGIPPEEVPNVFKRFFRASTATKASIPGFGIGLSLVYSIVCEHHGTITFDSTVGKGTVFTVTLPVGFKSTEQVDATA